MPVGIFNMAVTHPLLSSVAERRNEGMEGSQIFKFKRSEHVIAAKSCI